ncbi:MAG: HAD family phosphatase [Pseudomonadota bacterium]
MSKAVIFDVGCVLLDWDIYRLYRQMLPTDQAIAEFIDEVDLLHHNLEFDRGTSFQEGIAALVARFPHRKELLEAFDTRWGDTVSGAIDGSVEILEELKSAQVPVYAITNFARDKWHWATSRFDFLNHSFIDVVVSAHEGLVKPEPEIYNLLLQRNQLAAASCIFIDDSAKNVRGAADVGIDAIHFVEPAQLRRDLLSRGLPLKPNGMNE